MKRITAILLLFLFVFNIFGLYFAFKIKQTLIKKEVKTLMKRTIPDDQLTLIIQTPENSKDFEWKHSKEFCYHGEMYDIIRKETAPDETIKYYCFADKKETSLLFSFYKTVENTMDPCGKATDFSKKASHFFSGLYTTPEKFTLNLFFTTSLFFFNFSELLKVNYSALPSPPP